MKRSQSLEGGKDMLSGSPAGLACFRTRNAVQMEHRGHRKSGTTEVNGRIKPCRHLGVSEFHSNYNKAIKKY